MESATGLANVALGLGEPGLALAVGHGLVLQRALAALVAHRAVERVVDEQQLHHAALRLLGDRRGQLGADHHALGAGRGARGQRLELALDLDQALPAGADRVEQRVVAEPRYLDAEQLGGPDHQRALGDGDLEAVDGDGDAVRRHAAGIGRARRLAVRRGRWDRSSALSSGDSGEQGGGGGVERAAAAASGARCTRPGST